MNFINAHDQHGKSEQESNITALEGYSEILRYFLTCTSVSGVQDNPERDLTLSQTIINKDPNFVYLVYKNPDLIPLLESRYIRRALPMEYYQMQGDRRRGIDTNASKVFRSIYGPFIHPYDKILELYDVGYYEIDWKSPTINSERITDVMVNIHNTVMDYFNEPIGNIKFYFDPDGVAKLFLLVLLEK